MDRILILDFGGQTAQLIGRRIRDFEVYSEIVPGDRDIKAIIDSDVRGIILSGSPDSAWVAGAPAPDAAIFDIDLPVLGICYGFHQLVLADGGEVLSLGYREYGRAPVSVLLDELLFDGIPREFMSWMSHGDSVVTLGGGYEPIGISKNGTVAAARSLNKQFWGVQFHPEISHCEHGLRLLENFVCGICHAGREWNLENFVKQECLKLQEEVGDEDVLLLISGGVDSTVVAALLLKALGAERVWLMYVDTGLMRKDEGEEVEDILRSLGAKNILLVDAKERFLGRLAGVADPEEKRRIIGDVFIEVQRNEASQHLSGNYYLAQGTLYTDVIESGEGVGDKAHVIKSHHNVGTPLVRAKREAGELIEPLGSLYKDEVRRLGSILGMGNAIVGRHPFPGPGLAVRILSDVTEEKLRILREADDIYISELRSRGLYYRVWQAFCVLLPVRSVGVAGDTREYGCVLALRAVLSEDGMSADVFDFPMGDLLEISTRITNRVKGVGRVVYDISSKPPATIEWE